MLRRALSLPYGDQAPLLASLVLARSEPSGGDSRQIVDAAGYHRVVGYAIEAMEHGRLAHETTAWHELLARRTSETAQANLLRTELVQVRPVLEAACDAPPILVKGPAVADRFYHPARLRPFRDLDLLVPPARLDAAVGALEQTFGYRRAPEPWPGYGERQGHHVALTRKVGARPVWVELHWRLSDDPVARGLDHAHLLAGSQPLKLIEGSIPVPSVADQLLVLAVHLVQENRKRLAWINDLALVSRAASEPQWRTAFDGAGELGLSWVLHRALDYARLWLELDRQRPTAPGPPPAWGPLRASERFDGWPALQIGQLALGGWTEKNGYLRSAARARGRELRRIGRA